MLDTNAMMSVTDAIATRRSVRSYIPDTLDRATITSLLASAIRAPNAMDEQQWAFVVVQGKPLLKHLSEIARAKFVEELKQNSTEQTKHALQMFVNPDFNIFYDADTLIIICSHASEESFVGADCWLAAENLMLTAWSKGLGSCVIGSAVCGLNTPQLKAELDIPEEMTVIVPIIVGIPNGEGPITQRSEPRILSWKGGLQ
jgi:nitroreductase